MASSLYGNFNIHLSLLQPNPGKLHFTMFVIGVLNKLACFKKYNLLNNMLDIFCVLNMVVCFDEICIRKPFRLRFGQVLFFGEGFVFW